MEKHLAKIGIGLSLLAIIISSYVYFNTPKVAIVRSAVLIQKYEGMKEATANYEEKVKVWQSNLDTLTFDFQRAVNKYNDEYKSLSKSEQIETKQKLKQQGESLDKYKQAIYEKAKKEELESTEGALNQINSFIEAYAKEKNFTVVLGTTNSGNILYGSEFIDITQEVLDGLNAQYKK